MKFLKLIEIARALMPEYQYFRSFHVAFIIKGSKIYSIGWNKNKTDPYTHKYPYRTKDQKQHSEVCAIRKFRKYDYSKYDMIVLRIRNDNKLGMSKPCSGCAAILSEYGFKNIYYSTDEENFLKLNNSKEEVFI